MQNGAGQTLNTGGDTGGSGGATTTPPAGGGQQVATSSVAMDDFSGQMPTMPEDLAVIESSAGTLKADGDGTVDEGKAAAVAGDAGKKPGEGGDAAGGEPFHKHPRFQELIGKNKALETQLKTMAQQLESLAGGKGRGDGTQDRSDPSKEFQSQRAKIQEDMDEGKLSLAQGTAMLQEVSDKYNDWKVQTALQAQAREAEAAKIQENFLKENGDFTELRDSGKLQEIIDGNPLHDAFSAYYAHKAMQVEVTVKDAVEKAVKETEDRLRKEFQSKRNAASLGAGAAHVANTTDVNPALKDTKKYGGKTTVLAEMLKNMRSGGH